MAMAELCVFPLLAGVLPRRNTVTADLREQQLHHLFQIPALSLSCRTGHGTVLYSFKEMTGGVDNLLRR